MFSRSIWLLLVLVGPLAWASEHNGAEPKVGRVPDPSEVELWNIDVRPDGKGLPNGRGTVAQGQEVYTNNCQGCHGMNGQSGIKDRLVGGIGTLATEKPIKTVGSYWPYPTTLYDYVRRAMPYQAPGSLSNDEYYALTAYLLHLNGIVPADASLDKDNLTKVQMPNRDGFVPEPEFRQIVNSRQKSGKAH